MGDEIVSIPNYVVLIGIQVFIFTCFFAGSLWFDRKRIREELRGEELRFKGLEKEYRELKFEFDNLRVGNVGLVAEPSTSLDRLFGALTVAVKSFSYSSRGMEAEAKEVLSEFNQSSRFVLDHKK